MIEPQWTAAGILAQSGRTALITGANSGLGLATAQARAHAGATLLRACRDHGKGEQARASIPGSHLIKLELADLASVRECAELVSDQHDRLDLLILNAGAMAPPRRLTRDGFESQIGTNHLGPFALTGVHYDFGVRTSA